MGAKITVTEKATGKIVFSMITDIRDIYMSGPEGFVPEEYRTEDYEITWRELYTGER